MTVDFDRIEKAGKVHFNPEQRKIIKSLMVVYTRPEKNEPEMVSSLKEARSLLEGMARKCLDTVEALYKYNSLWPCSVDFSDLSHEPDEPSDKRLWFTATEKIVIEAIVTLSRLAKALEYNLKFLSKPKTGRPIDGRMAAMIFLAYSTFINAGGGSRSLVFWNDAAGCYDGDFYHLVREMFKQIGYDYKSDIALGKKLERYISRLNISRFHKDKKGLKKS